MLSGKTVVLGVSGGIAAYKAANLASMLVKLHAEVHVLMTDNAAKFISPVTFEALTGNRCITDTFDREGVKSIEHIALAEKADLFIVAPASANTIAKLAAGMADDMLSTTFLAYGGKKLVAPAMNTKMYENPVTKYNLQKLRDLGYTVIPPSEGRLACGAVGAGKLPSESELLDYILYELAYEKDLAGLKVLVTAGPTQEPIDPVRYITNHSSGKMGYALARAATLRGATVTLVSGPTALMPPPFMDYIPVVSAMDMFEAVTARSDQQDIIIKAAAVADYRPAQVAQEKIKKSEGGMKIELERNPDILQWLGDHRKKGQFLCGFAMETQNTLENARLKLKKKNADLIAANCLRDTGAGFQGDTNILTLITETEELPLAQMTKDDAAHRILDLIIKLREKV